MKVAVVDPFHFNSVQASRGDTFVDQDADQILADPDLSHRVCVVDYTPFVPAVAPKASKADNVIAVPVKE